MGHMERTIVYCLLGNKIQLEEISRAIRLKGRYQRNKQASIAEQSLAYISSV